MQTKGVLVVVSGFSGAGKGTVMKALLNKYDNYALSVSATTRNPRPGEENGREYFFLTESQFEDMIKNDELIEHARYVDHYYGTPKKYVEEKYKELLAQKKVLGVSIREGYQKLAEIKPQGIWGHSIQTPVTQLINDVKKYMEEWDVNTVFFTCHLIEQALSVFVNVNYI